MRSALPEFLRGLSPLGRVSRTLTRCLVCGFAEVRTDEVVDRGLVLLNECPRCEHRWTAPGDLSLPMLDASPAPTPLPRGPVRTDREVADAA